MVTVETPPSREPARRPKRRRSGRARALTAVGIVLMLLGASAIGYVVWEFYGTNIVSKRHHASNIAAIEKAWSENTDATQIKGVGLVRIPRWGDDWQMPILDGFDLGTLAQGVGRDPDNAMPGEVGNLALAGHRRSNGESFREFPKLRVGDEVIVETRTHVYTYELIDDGTDFKVDFTTSWPLWPVPDESRPGAKPTEKMVTLLTCAELFSSDWRSVARGVLVDERPKTGGGRQVD